MSPYASFIRVLRHAGRVGMTMSKEGTFDSAAINFSVVFSDMIWIWSGSRDEDAERRNFPKDLICYPSWAAGGFGQARARLFRWFSISHDFNDTFFFGRFPPTFASSCTLSSAHLSNTFYFRTGAFLFVSILFSTLFFFFSSLVSIIKKPGAENP